MPRNIIHVVGTGTIGEPLIGILSDFKQELGIDEVTFHKNTPLTTDRSKVISLLKRGARLSTKAESFDQIEILFNHTLLKIDEDKHKLVFTNGKQIPLAEHIFGADGLNSSLRKFIDKNS